MKSRLLLVLIFLTSFSFANEISLSDFAKKNNVTVSYVESLFSINNIAKEIKDWSEAKGREVTINETPIPSNKTLKKQLQVLKVCFDRVAADFPKKRNNAFFITLQNNGIIDSGAHCGDDFYWACEINVGKDVTTDECYKLIVLNFLDNHK